MFRRKQTNKVSLEALVSYSIKKYASVKKKSMMCRELYSVLQLNIDYLILFIRQLSFSVLALDELTYFFYLTDIETVEGIEIKEVQQLSDYNVGFAVMERTSFYKIMQNEFNENNQEDLDFTKVKNNHS